MVKKVLFAIMVVALLSSCGMGWNQTVKNFKSDLGGGLEREIIVENTRTGQELWRYSGKAYIDDESFPGNITIVYWIGNETKKYDAIGRDYGVRSVEK
jgi:hypothetical protein